MNAMLTDDDLADLLTEAAETYAVPERGPSLLRGEGENTPPVRPLHRRRWVQTSAAAAMVAGALVAGSLFSGGGPATTDGPVAGSTATTGLAPIGQAGPKAGVPTSATDSAAAPVPAAAAPNGVQRGATTNPVVAPAPAPDRVVKSGTIALVVDDKQVTPTLNAVQTAVEGLQGYVSTSSTQELGARPTGTVTFRIPVGNFERAVARVRTLGGVSVRSAGTSGQDVTAQYADTAAQLSSLRAARNRFLTILARANTIGETLTVQQRVDDVQSQIDRLEGQRQLLANQSDLATLTVLVNQKDDPILAQQTKTEGGFARAWREARDGFSSGVQGIIARSGRGLLVLLVLVGLAVVLRLGWRIARRQLL